MSGLDAGSTRWLVCGIAMAAEHAPAGAALLLPDLVACK
jgi:hypothetical protein